MSVMGSKNSVFPITGDGSLPRCGRAVEFVCGDFAAVIEAAGEGDVIFAIRRMNRFQIQRDSRTIPA